MCSPDHAPFHSRIIPERKVPEIPITASKKFAKLLKELRAGLKNYFAKILLLRRNTHISAKKCNFMTNST
jgi:hypothetical protein